MLPPAQPCLQERWEVELLRHRSLDKGWEGYSGVDADRRDNFVGCWEEDRGLIISADYWLRGLLLGYIRLLTLMNIVVDFA